MEDILVQGLAAPFLVSTTDDRRLAIEPGAFTESIAAGGIELWFNHDPRTTVATMPGRLTVLETERGVFFSALVPGLAWYSARQRAKGNKVRGCSVGWADERAFTNHQGFHVITKARLKEISVMFDGDPAFPGTWAQITL